MKSNVRARVLCCAAVVLGLFSGFALPQAAQAQNNPLIAVDENGNGTLLFPGGLPIVTQGVLMADPGPGGLASALTFNLLGPPSLVFGDLIVVDLAAGTSDLIRFNPAGTGGVPNYPASLVFYSNDAFGQLADTGLPTALYTTVLSEVEGGTGCFLLLLQRGSWALLPGSQLRMRSTAAFPVPSPVLDCPA